MPVDGITPPPADEDRRQDRPALLLVESLIHELVAGQVIGLPRAVEVVTAALETQIEFCTERGENHELNDAVAALTALRSSLLIDLGTRAGHGFVRAVPPDGGTSTDGDGRGN